MSEQTLKLTQLQEDLHDVIEALEKFESLGLLAKKSVQAAIDDIDYMIEELK